nr:beta-glucosidase [Ancylobacter lacus]
MGGFECSTHRRGDGERLDLIAATGHDRHAEADYRQLKALGIEAMRDGLRWHLIERGPGLYDWSSLRGMAAAARRADVQVVWDLCHYGWPDRIDIWSVGFVERFADFAAAAARVLREEGETAPFVCPINEISFWSWAGGELGHIAPFAQRRGSKLKRQLARAAIAATRAVRAEAPAARFITAEPLIHVAPSGTDAEARQAAEAYHLSQFEACDMICGRLAPELGGREDLLDMVGVNFYPSNQWALGGSILPLGHHAYRPLADLLGEVHRRYGRPLLVSETGAEGSARAAWLHYVCDEARVALQAGVPLVGLCLYPVLDYPGWDNDRICATGLLSPLDPWGARSVHPAFAAELARQQALFAGFPAPSCGSRTGTGMLAAP